MRYTCLMLRFRHPMTRALAAASPVALSVALTITLVAACGSSTRGHHASGPTSASTDDCGGYSWCSNQPTTGSNGSNNSQSAPSPDCGGYSWCTTPAPGYDAKPIVSPTTLKSHGGVPIDPPYEDGYTDPGKDCLVNLAPAASGISFTDSSFFHVQGKLTLICAVPPAVLTLTMRLQYKNAAGNWIDEAPIDVINHPSANGILPMVPKHLNPQAACYPGAWRVEVYWQGLKRDGQPFPDPGQPSDLTSLPQRVTC